MRSSAWLLLWAAVFAFPGAADEASPRLSPATLRRIATVDERYQSYNLKAAGTTQALAPVDLSQPRLRKLAAALGPAYVRASGTADEWKGVVDFARAVNARVVASFDAGARDAAGMSMPDRARKLIARTKSIGGHIAAAELADESAVPSAGGAAEGPDAAAFARDVGIFRRLARQASPHTLIVGPGSAVEGTIANAMLRGEALLSADPKPVFDVFSYRYYGAVPARCSHGNPELLTTADQAMSEEWLSRVDKVQAVHASLRDRFAAQRPIWVTEIADAACGGNPWAAAFLDTFRYVDQLARLAKQGVKVHMHDSLASGDSGLLDAKTLTPRPNYWAALLWRRLMGTTVLDAGASREGLHLYAHCLRGHRGGVVILAVNNTRNQPRQIELPVAAERYTLSARRLLESRVDLNGNQLMLRANGELPQIRGVPTLPGTVPFVPATITFVAVANAGNPNCR